MRSRSIVAALAFLLCGTGLASAQSLSLEFHDGRVRLKAENVPVARVLSEWTRLGGTKIVNGERVPGAPLTLQLVDVPEQQAIDIILRGAAGYMVLARETPVAGQSAFDRILVLPTTTRTPVAAATPAPPPVAPPQPAFNAEREPIEVEDTDNGLPPQPQQQGPPAAVFPRGRVPGLNLPQGGPLPQQAQPVPRDEDAPPPNPPNPNTQRPGNPFGVMPGASSRPGTVTPAPPQQNPNPNVQRDQRQQQ